MHYITSVEVGDGYTLYLQFETGEWRAVDLKDRLDGEVFEPLKDMAQFGTAELNEDIDTVVWANGADMSPDFLFKIGTPVKAPPSMLAAEVPADEYKGREKKHG